MEREIFLSLIIPCYNEEATLENCVGRCLELEKRGIKLELIIVNDCSTDNSAAIGKKLASDFSCVKYYELPVNSGKGAALKHGFAMANGDYVGIQDADAEYNPLDYSDLLKPMLEGKADVVYGSRYLRRGQRRVLYFWHTWMNRALTFVSNMFTNLDISDMETCYKLFKKETIKELAPRLKENRFGFEPEITSLVARNKCKVYEGAIDYTPRSYEEGKKIGWKDGVRALYCILHYGAPYAPLPMQLLLYFFIGSFCALLDVASFAILKAFGFSLLSSVVFAFIIAAIVNYLLCVSLLFRSGNRWKLSNELIIYLAGTACMCLLDYIFTYALINWGLNPVFAKAISSSIGFFGNFYLRKYLVF